MLVRLRGRLAGALAARAANRPAQVVAECRAGLQDLAVHRSALPTIELRALASGHGAELGEIGLGVVLEGGSPAQRSPGWSGPGRPRSWQTDSRLRCGRWATGSETSDPSGPMVVRRPPKIDDGPRVSAADGRRSTSSRSHRHGRSLGIAPLRAALDGRTLVEIGKFAGRLVAVVGERSARASWSSATRVEVEAELTDRCCSRCDGWRTRGPGRRGGSARASADLRDRTMACAAVGAAGVDPDDER